jgi:pyridoxamine 5'-phosphate oxidase
MADRDGIFAGNDPFEIARRWLSEAERSEPNDPSAAALATVDSDGLPNVRMVLVKEIADDGLVFFTNYESAKGRELTTTPKAAIVLHWKSMRRQVRARGPAFREDGARADAYYDSRSLGSRIGAWASAQSRPLGSKADLVKAAAAAGLDLTRPASVLGWVPYRTRGVRVLGRWRVPPSRSFSLDAVGSGSGVGSPAVESMSETTTLTADCNPLKPCYSLAVITGL